MNNHDMLANIRIASPCPARWADMTGDDRSRFCAQCEKHVYHLSGMTTEAIAALIREKEGDLCARFYQRPDGNMLTADCPVGAARFPRRLQRMVLASVPLLVAAAMVNAWAGGQFDRDPTAQPGRFSQVLDGAVMQVKDWLGLAPRRAVMGMICGPPRKPATSAPPSAAFEK